MLINNVYKTIEGKSFNKYLPFAGVFAGSLTGMVANYLTTNSYFGKLKGQCNIKLDGSFFNTINNFKQKEIKYFSLITPFVPLIGKVAYTTYLQKHKITKITDLTHVISQEVKQVSSTEVLSSASLIAVTMLTNSMLLYSRNQLYQNDYYLKNFDPSGHVMLKTALAIALSASMDAIFKTAHPQQALLSTLFASVIAASDAVLMYNTSACHHSVAEVIAGAIILAGLSFTVNKVLANNFFLKNPTYVPTSRLNKGYEVQWNENVR
jgi:hypothetical protein